MTISSYPIPVYLGCLTCFDCILINHVLIVYSLLDIQAVPDEEPLPNTAFSPPGATFSL